MKTDPEDLALLAQKSLGDLVEANQLFNRRYKFHRITLRELEKYLKKHPPASVRVIQRSSPKGKIQSDETISGEVAVQTFKVSTLAGMIARAKGRWSINQPLEVHLDANEYGPAPTWVQIKSIVWQTPKKSKKAK